MGLMGRGLDWVFGDGRNVVAETAGIFRENAEAAARREAGMKDAALAQLAEEFARPRAGLFDRLIDGLNRLPRPLLAFGTLGLFGAAMVDPIWFASRMEGIQLVPEPLWWLMGAIVSFYFGARHQAKGQDFQRSVAETMARAGTVARNVERLERMAAPPAPANPALEDWRREHG
ncbi:holin family protein [Histidinibacterium aquaticum]|uniref:Carboxylesterase n=1 Tax=Histidinibacterium aquaticum TaxID=2613962 RepID=A0A5J5GL31_9RHOB|nr:holin family protein [Histidinibacterium aquaticum]KAA9009009.1 carboxylesterase [Histidinibacterium aquaticum]